MVNTIAAHPELPIIATGGIDSEVKVWDVGPERNQYMEDESDGGESDASEEVSVAAAGESGVHRISRSESKRAQKGPIRSPLDWDKRIKDGAPNVTVPDAEARMGGYCGTIWGLCCKLLGKLFRSIELILLMQKMVRINGNKPWPGLQI